MDLSTILIYILVGLIIGALARLLVSGTAGMSIIATILIGIVGAVGGGWLYAELGGTDTEGFDWIEFFVAVAVAAVLVALYAGLTRGRRRDRI